MGFIDSSPTEPYFYNVINAVGEQCPNTKDDVMMVQYLLHHLYKNAPVHFKPAGEMTVDGICGPTTIRWIREYQNQMYMNGTPIRPDGRVDRIRNKDTFEGGISKTLYTLYCLNCNVADTDPKAYAELPKYVPLANPLNVPPPSNDVISGLKTGAIAGQFGNMPEIEQVPATGGF